MAQKQLATRIDAGVKAAVERYCGATGLKMSKFIENALLEKLEEIADLEDLKAIRHEPTRPLEKVLKELGID